MPKNVVQTGGGCGFERISARYPGAFDLLFRRRDRIRRQTDEMRMITDDKVAAYYREMAAVGLGFNFKETR